jgi:hypothetical protein
MIKAGSLFYAIVISLIIAIVSSSLILFAYLTHIQFETFETNQRLERNADSGLNLLLSKQTWIALNEKKTIDLYEQGIDSVELTRKAWGAYEIAISKAVFKNTSFLRIAQIGYYQDSTQTYSLYLADEDKPLALCGKTIIKGTAYLPKAGVKRAYIEGQNFVGNELIEGVSKLSKKTLPEFSKPFIDAIQSVFTNKQVSENDSTVMIESELSGDSIHNSFLNNTLVLHCKNKLRMADGFYTGNVAIISDQQITIAASAIVKDVLIFAPRVIVEKGFNGNLQIFASDSVIVEKNVTLLYPSVIGLLRGAQSPTVAGIVLNENDTISGNVFAYKKSDEVFKQSGITLAEKSFIYGQVYSNGYIDIKGTIYGSLMCNKIILKTPSSVYENHLLNAVINRSKLSTNYVGINLVEESTIKKVVKWGN